MNNTTQQHKPLIGIVGQSGSGKSSSLRGLDPATTIILDGERKGFPFKGGERFIVRPFSTPQEFIAELKAAKENQAIQTIVIESFTKLAEYAKTFCQSAYKGFDIWSNYAKLIRSVLNECKNSHAVVIWTAIDEIVDIPGVDGTESAKRLVSIDGKELKGKIEYEFLMVFFTDVRKSKDGKNMEYFFQTNTDGTTSAKSPMGMFSEQLIPNDMAAVLKKMKEYYAT